MPCGSLLRTSAPLPAHAHTAWHELAARCGATWADVVLAATACHVHRHAGAPEVILGVMMMVRLGSTTARTPVMTMNIVPMRVPTPAGTSLPNVIRAVAGEMRAIRPHQHYRSEHLRRELRLVGGGRRLYGPLVNVMPFDYGADFADCRAVARNLSVAQYLEDLALHLHVRADGRPPLLDIEGNPRCYDLPRLTAHLDGLTRLLAKPLTT